MIKLLFIFFIAMFFAWLSSKYEVRTLADGWDYNRNIKFDIGFVLLLIAIIMFAGFRTDYNDTWNYYRAFRDYSVDFKTFLSDDNNTNLLKNPAFNFYSWALRRITTSKTALILPPSLFTEYSLIRFMKRYSVNFTFSVYLFFTLGMFCFTMGAMKQSIAIGILTYAISAADNKKYIRFLLLVFLAFLFHTYAIVLVVVPFLRAKPWSWLTWVMVVIAIVVFNNLEGILGSIIDASEDAGKTLYEEELLEGTGSNLFRIAVYAVPPLISFIFQKNLFKDSQPIENICVHLSILSFACMAYGLVVTGNMADRLATYFEIGTIISFPWMLEKSMNKKYYQLISFIAYPLFFAFFYYKFGINNSFDKDFKSSLPFIDMLG